MAPDVSSITALDLISCHPLFVMSSSVMDWEPAESYGMDIDDPYLPMHYTAVQEVHMASPVFVSQPLPIIEDTFFLPPLEFNTKPLAFPPLKFPPPQAWEHKRNIPLTAISAQSSITPSATSQGVTHKSAPDNHHHVLERSVTSQNAKTAPLSVDAIPSYIPKMPSYHPNNLVTSPSKTRVTVDQNSLPLLSNCDCLPICLTLTVTPSSSKSRTNPRPILIPIVPVCNLESLPTIPEETLLHGHSGDTPPATLRPPIKTTVPAQRPHRTIGNNIAPSDGNLLFEIPSPPGWLDWALEQDLTPSTPHPIIAETNTPPGWPDWIVNDNTTPVSQYPVLESTTPSPQTTTFQEYLDPGLDLIGLFTPNPRSSNSSNLIDESALRAFGGSTLEDLDWILEGFRATNITVKNGSKPFESVNYENKFVPAPLGIFSPVSPYDWAPVSDVGPDLITFDSTHDLSHWSSETALVLATTLSGSFELPSFKSGDGVQTESNRLFQTSTPACDRLATCAVAPTLVNANTPEIVITTRNSPSSIDCSPLSDIPDPLHSPFHPIYHDGNALAEFSKVAYTVERNALRNVKAFKNKLSFKVQKLQVGTKTSVATQNDIDVFGEIANVIDKRMARSTKVDASTQTEKLVGAAYSTSFKMYLFFCLFLMCTFFTFRTSPTTPVFAVFSLFEVGPRFYL